MTIEIATLAGGCFWCLESAFNRLNGVQNALSGYMGGKTANPTYKEICRGDSGHAEVVQIHFDPSQISYAELLDIFFTLHDPTTLNRQGNDVGSQYRSAIFWHSTEQKIAAETAITTLTAENTWSNPIVTQITPAETFWPAEDYHQRYYDQNPNQPYCMYVVGPKLHKFRERFGERLKQEN